MSKGKELKLKTSLCFLSLLSLKKFCFVAFEIGGSNICSPSFPCGSAGKESACNTGDLGVIPGMRRSPGERKGYPLQYSGLENSMDVQSVGSQRVGHN